MSNDRKAIIEVLVELGEPATPIEIARLAGLKHGNVKKLAARMAKEGLLTKTDKGKYSPTGDTGDTGTSPGDISMSPMSPDPTQP